MTTTPTAPPPPAPPPAAPPVPAATPPPKSGGCLKWGLIGCGVVIVLGAAFCAVLMFGVFATMKHSNVYKEALARAQNDPRVQAALGTPIEPGWWTSGSVHFTNGSGDADINIPISGPKASGRIHAVATIEDGNMKFERLSMKPEHGDRIDLLSPP
jgi:hypothetical protein